LQPMSSLATVFDTWIDNDTLLAITVALPTLTDLLRFVLSSQTEARRLYFTTTSYGSGDGGDAAVVAVAAQVVDTWSIAEEVARRWLVKSSVT
jgi:hypothetical protein